MDSSDVALAFGRRIRRRRHAAHLSQDALAELAGCHPTYISLVELGKRNPSLDTVLKLAHGLDCPAWKLVRETENDL